jgi:hypothetical protein
MNPIISDKQHPDVWIWFDLSKAQLEDLLSRGTQIAENAL